MSNKSKRTGQKDVPVDNQHIQLVVHENPVGTLYEKCIKSCDVRADEDFCMLLRSRSKQSISSLRNITVGSEISFGRCGYKHHAVVVSVNDTNKIYKIIHLSGDSFGASKASSSSGDGKAQPVEQGRTMTQTPQRSSFYYEYDQQTKKGQRKGSFDPEIVQERAQALTEVMLAVKGVDYHVRNFNCQHFASYCVTGVPFCKKYQKDLCCFKRGIEVNKEAKNKLDEGLKAYFQDKLDKLRSPATKEKKEGALDVAFSSGSQGKQ